MNSVMTRPPKIATCHRDPWAIVRRGGDQEGHRISVRVAYLVGTIVGSDGKATAMTGYLSREDMTGWTKTPRPIPWETVVKRFRGWSQPTVAQVRAAKRKLPIADS